MDNPMDELVATSVTLLAAVLYSLLYTDFAGRLLNLWRLLWCSNLSFFAHLSFSVETLTSSNELFSFQTMLPFDRCTSKHALQWYLHRLKCWSLRLNRQIFDLTETSNNKAFSSSGWYLIEERTSVVVPSRDNTESSGGVRVGCPLPLVDRREHVERRWILPSLHWSDALCWWLLNQRRWPVKV